MFWPHCELAACIPSSLKRWKGQTCAVIVYELAQNHVVLCIPTPLLLREKTYVLTYLLNVNCERLHDCAWIFPNKFLGTYLFQDYFQSCRFRSYVNPIFQPEGADYVHHITASTPGFENLTTSLTLVQLNEYQTVPYFHQFKAHFQ